MSIQPWVFSGKPQEPLILLYISYEKQLLQKYSFTISLYSLHASWYKLFWFFFSKHCLTTPSIKCSIKYFFLWLNYRSLPGFEILQHFISFKASKLYWLIYPKVIFANVSINSVKFKSLRVHSVGFFFDH